MPQTNDHCDLCGDKPGEQGLGACCVSCQKVFCIGHFNAEEILVRKKQAVPADYMVICCDCHTR